MTKRRHLPSRRTGYSQKFTISGSDGVNGVTIHFWTGEYDDGTLGEIFIKTAKAGAAYRHLLDCFAKSISIGLQYGVPLKELVDAFEGEKFPPSGKVTGHESIVTGTSVIDVIFQDLQKHYGAKAPAKKETE